MLKTYQEKADRIYQYYEVEALSQSKIKDLLYPKAKTKKNEGLLTAGSLFDCLVTTPELESLFFIQWNLNVKIPGGKVKQVVDVFHKRYPEAKDFSQHLDELKQVIEEEQYQTNWTMPVRMSNIITKAHGEAYLMHLHEKGRKTIVDAASRSKLGEYANEVRYKHRDLLEHAVTQEPIYFNFNGVPCKGLPDILIEYDDSVEFYDLKYTELPLADYYREIRARRSDIQISFYTYGIEQVYGKPAVGKLLVYSTVDKDTAIIPFSNLDLQIARYGAVMEVGKIHIEMETGKHTLTNTVNIKGWQQVFGDKPVLEEVQSIWH